MTRTLWPVGCIACGFDASFQPPEIVACPSCGGRLVAAAPETLEYLHDPTSETPPETTLADVEFMLMIDYLTTFGSEARFRRGVSEDDVLDEARRLVCDHAIFRVEIFRREIRVPWEKVEELRRSHVMHE